MTQPNQSELNHIPEVRKMVLAMHDYFVKNLKGEIGDERD